MFSSARYSNLFLRVGLALAFLYFGISKFAAPQLWLDSWVPMAVQNFFLHIHIGGHDLANIVGLVEVLTALSLATGFFSRIFAVVGIVILTASVALHGMDAPLAYTATLVGGLAALIMWPQRSY